MKSLDARFQWLAENLLLGKQRTDICEGYYGFPEGQRAVFYLFGSSTTDVIGTPHKGWIRSVFSSALAHE